MECTSMMSSIHSHVPIHSHLSKVIAGRDTNITHGFTMWRIPLADDCQNCIIVGRDEIKAKPRRLYYLFILKSSRVG